MEFKNRYVLGEGFPWAYGVLLYPKCIGITKEPCGSNYAKMNFPEELWASDAPKYRLVLEKVK